MRLPRRPFRPAWRLRAATLLAAGLALSPAGCMRSSYSLASRGMERSATSADREADMGRKLARQVEKELPLVADEALQTRVRDIGQRLAAVCDRKDVVYSFAVVEHDTLNAFSLPGGYVFLHKKLVDETDNDDELAGVLAHEIAHVAARHSVKRFETGIGLQLLQLAVLAAARQGAAAQGLSVLMQATSLAYARQDELEADRLSVQYMKKAGFDPKGMITFLARLREHHADDTHYMPRGVIRPQYALTHPYVADRIRVVKEELYGVADYIDYLNTSVE